MPWARIDIPRAAQPSWCGGTNTPAAFPSSRKHFQTTQQGQSLRNSAGGTPLLSLPSLHRLHKLPAPVSAWELSLKITHPQILSEALLPGQATGAGGQGGGCHVLQSHVQATPAPEWAKRNRATDPVYWTAAWQNDPCVHEEGFSKQFRRCTDASVQ